MLLLALGLSACAQQPVRDQAQVVPLQQECYVETYYEDTDCRVVEHVEYQEYSPGAAIMSEIIIRVVVEGFLHALFYHR